MDLMGYRILQLAGQLPTLLVLLTGLVLALTRRDRLPRRARTLLLSGVVVLLLVELVGMFWTLAVPQLISMGRPDESINAFALFTKVSTAIAWIGYPVGIGLVLAAAFAGRQPAADWAGWTPPAADESHADPAPTAAGPAPTAQWGATDVPPHSPGQA
ncbi:hypothetical protein V6U81_18180 [Micromonospora sp. CPCC 205711]|uniref:hypothetical protein n=1 Tax=Micromonospora sp. CPCC 205547 TaxID=3122400 RepID=UPI002FF18C99